MAPPKATASLPPRYRVVRHLADGGMASVFEAHDELLDRTVAVKVLSDALSADDAARKRFTREARAAARLSEHPNVVTVYDAGEHDGAAYLVMAFYPGGSVGTRLRRSTVGTDEALRWLAEAAGALDYAHAHGVVHRDVKPDNLLLDRSEQVAVGDFGIATAAWESSLTQTGLVLGTMAYLAPEQRAGDPATPASDRYALAVVAHELLTGVRPTARREPGQGRPLAPVVAEVLERGLADDPATRPASCAALVAELERALDGEDPTAVTRPAPSPRPRARAVPVPAPVPVPDEPAPTTAARTPRAPAPPPPVDAPPARRSRRTAVAAGVAALVLLGGGGAVLAAQGGDDGGSQRADGERTTATRTRSTQRSTATQAPPATTQAAAPATTQAAPATTTDDAPAATGAGDAAGLSHTALVRLNDRGYALSTQGSYAQAVAPLQTAVAGLCADESDLTCAYALYNLGRALRLSGNASAAVPYLQRRLAISDFRTDVVRAELALAQSGDTSTADVSGGSGSAAAAPEGTSPPAAPAGGGNGDQGGGNGTEGRDDGKGKGKEG